MKSELVVHATLNSMTYSAAVWPWLGEGRQGLLRHIALGHKLNFKCHFKISKKSSLEVLEQKENFVRRNWLLFDTGPYKEWLALAVVARFY